ncbi:MAG TPA: 5-oxoprolinase subunit PxpA [Acidimicrobiales bacterium]|nr:5-oxoprolinase subunit PxpA [Acidimicrobiales bacterium]
MTAVRVDLNADLGEGAGTDHELLAIVTSTSVACGGHAGDEESMRWVTAQAATHGVVVGAHPSYPDREGFGRRAIDIDGTDLVAAVTGQVSVLMSLSARPVRFVKAHGALYNRAAADASVAGSLVDVAADRGLPLLCPGRSEIWRVAMDRGVACFAEAFADRAYAPDGSLAARGTPGAVIDDPGVVAERAVRLVRHGVVEATDGSMIAVPTDSICIHGDTPGAVPLARAVRRALSEAGIEVRSFLEDR